MLIQQSPIYNVDLYNKMSCKYKTKTMSDDLGKLSPAYSFSMYHPPFFLAHSFELKIYSELSLTPNLHYHSSSHLQRQKFQDCQIHCSMNTRQDTFFLCLWTYHTSNQYHQPLSRKNSSNSNKQGKKTVRDMSIHFPLFFMLRRLSCFTKFHFLIKQVATLTTY